MVVFYFRVFRRPKTWNTNPSINLLICFRVFLCLCVFVFQCYRKTVFCGYIKEPHIRLKYNLTRAESLNSLWSFLSISNSHFCFFFQCHEKRLWLGSERVTRSFLKLLSLSCPFCFPFEIRTEIRVQGKLEMVFNDFGL